MYTPIYPLKKYVHNFQSTLFTSVSLFWFSWPCVSRCIKTWNWWERALSSLDLSLSKEKQREKSEKEDAFLCLTEMSLHSCQPYVSVDLTSWPSSQPGMSIAWMLLGAGELTFLSGSGNLRSLAFKWYLNGHSCDFSTDLLQSLGTRNARSYILQAHSWPFVKVPVWYLCCSPWWLESVCETVVSMQL